ncbi:MAG: Gfo/Idh/MocA family protein [Candidatus Thorarchaeota archaeon]|jgi:predicted dehydrogenase
MNPIDIIIVGAGDRGNVYAEFAIAHPERARIVGIAEPREYYRDKMAQDHTIAPENVFNDWKEIVVRERFADAAIVTTPDALHVEPAIALAKKGYHILLEKPMAPDEEGCRKITKAVLDNDVILSVGHVLRYTMYTKKLKELLDSGVIGDIVSLQRLEPVGYWHQAHSFVRGNWRREEESTFMLLAKSCHDIDWISYIMGKKCKTISSFGSLVHFRSENKPKDAGTRCVQCDYELECPYSSLKIYLGFLDKGITGWPVNVITPDVTEAGIKQALMDGPYGRCVYDCDNDVVDHQVVNMEFEGNLTAAFTMTAFTKARARETRIFGSRGEIYGDGSTIHVYDFLTEQTQEYDTTADTTVLTDHGGGDYWLMHAFVSAVANKNPNLILSGPTETLESHLMTFAAERSRREKRTISLDNDF